MLTLVSKCIVIFNQFQVSNTRIVVLACLLTAGSQDHFYSRTEGLESPAKTSINSGSKMSPVAKDDRLRTTTQSSPSPSKI